MKLQSGDHHVRLLQGSNAYFAALVVSIDAARDEVYLETYIFDFHGAALNLAHALVRAAHRGVRVRVLVDGVGTDDISSHWASMFEQSGVQWRVYSPLRRIGFWRYGGIFLPKGWRRLHRKLVVVDSKLAFCGGINVLDDWFDPKFGALKHPRFDFVVAVRGPLVHRVRADMAHWWAFPYTDPPLAWGGKVPPLKSEYSREESRLLQTDHPVRAFLLLHDHFFHRHRIEKAYTRAIALAQDEVLIANAYFMPGRKVRKALVLAATRGVRVRLLLQGLFESYLHQHAGRAVYGLLLEAGVEIYEYQSSFLHAKVAVVDPKSQDAWSTVGSSNLDPVSFLLAKEANVVVRGQAFAQELYRRLEYAIAEHSSLIEKEIFLQRSWLERLQDRLSLSLVRTVLLVTGNDN